MKPGKPDVVEKEQLFFDDVHQTEEEIDLFLKERKEEADRILQDALRQVEDQKDEVLRATHEEKVRIREDLIRLAEEQAAGLLEEASRGGEQENASLEGNRSAVTGKILEYLLRGTE